jgi:hypothetical protein
MALTEKRLGAGRPTDTNNLTIYTIPAVTTGIIKSIRVCNTTATAATCRVFLTPTGGAADQTTAIYYDFNIPANSTLSDDGFHILAAAGTVQVRSGTASALTFTCSGAEITT